MFDLKQLKHDNARLAAFLAAEQTTGGIPIRVGSRCMASIWEPTEEDSQATRRVAGKLTAIMGGEPELVTIQYQGKEYFADSEGLSGWFPRAREEYGVYTALSEILWEDYPEAEACEWRDVYALLQNRRAAVYEPSNIYTLLEEMLSITV